jgi:hypothetical protein
VIITSDEASIPQRNVRGNLLVGTKERKFPKNQRSLTKEKAYEDAKAALSALAQNPWKRIAIPVHLRVMKNSIYHIQ